MQITIESISKLNESEKEQVLKINYENLIKNGGQLKVKGILDYDHAVIAKHNDQIIGYVLLKDSYCFYDDLYVMQTAVDKKYHHCGIGTAMYKYIYRHSKGYKILSAKVNLNNKVSQDFHKKNRFKIFDHSDNQVTFVKLIKRTSKFDLNNSQKEEITLKSKNEFVM